MEVRIIGNLKRLKDVSSIMTGVLESKENISQGYKYNYIQLSALGMHDVITDFEEHVRKDALNDSALIKKGDILVKRISPGYVNVIDFESNNTYVTSNVLIIRPDRSIDSQYLAMILEMQGLSRLNHFTKKGATIHSISKKELNEIMIPILPIEEQQKYGKLRVLTNKKVNLLEKLIIEENKQLKAVFQQLIMEG
jgi:restriction endonuclease S subunit